MDATPALNALSPNFLFFRKSQPKQVKQKESSQKSFNFNPRWLLPIGLIMLCVYVFFSEKKESTMPPVPKSDAELLHELDQNFYALKNSFSHLSAAARMCARDSKSRACELLQKSYGQFLREGYRAPLSTPTNVTIRQLSRESRIFPGIAHLLKTKKADVGRILSTDRIFDLGREYFMKLVEKKRMSLTVDIRNIEWILLLQGYSLEQWAKNKGYEDVKSLRPQFEKVPADHNVKDLFTGSATQEQLRRAGFEKIQDIIDFIGEHKGNWEIAIREKGVGLHQVKDLKDSLIDTGYENEVTKYERQ